MTSRRRDVDSSRLLLDSRRDESTSLRRAHTVPLKNGADTFFIPGDKSISHRAIILSALSNQVVKIENLLFADDVFTTVNAMRALGVEIQLDEKNKTAIVHGVGLRGLKAPTKPIDCGNSGTTMRLLAGLLAAQPFHSVLTGDDSLSKRPMARIAKPLRLMGATIELSETHTAPIKIAGNPALTGIIYEPIVASAQVKSCVLLAGLTAGGETIIKEKIKTRDHTERMLKTFHDLRGTRFRSTRASCAEQVRKCVITQTIKIPGDISAAAFFMVATAITPGASLIIREVGINPHRTGIIDILKNMGAEIALLNKTVFGAEPVADIRIKYAPLKGIDIPAATIVSAIDEFPAVFIAAATAQGKTTLRGAQELRVKETDRIAAMAAGMKTLGVPVEVFDDGLQIEGIAQFQGGTINSFKDHRIAMAFAIARLRSDSPIEISDFDCVATSFPEFMRLFAVIENDY